MWQELSPDDEGGMFSRNVGTIFTYKSTSRQSSEDKYRYAVVLELYPILTSELDGSED
jgi:hypothetical protein